MTAATRNPQATVLALHHGYRTPGGEERAATQLAELAETELGERIAWVRRDSTQISAGAAARGLLAGGTGSAEVADAIASSGADLLHAHNLFPTFGPAALRAAREAGAGVVVHLHNYRLVCAVATNVRDGHDCTECHRGKTMPGLRHRCRGSLPEAAAYAAALPRWQNAVIELADVVIVPSTAARTRLLDLGLELPIDRVHVIGGVAPHGRAASTASAGHFALLVTRLAPEKDVRTAIEACRRAGIPLVIAGDGPDRAALEAYAGPLRHPAAPPPPHLPPPSRDPFPYVVTRPPSTLPANAATARATSDHATEALLGSEVLALLDAAPSVHGEAVFVGRVSDAVLAALRARARIGLATSVAHETFGLSALESMAAALPTAGSAVGALPELLGDDCTVPPGDPAALAELITRLAGDDTAGNAAAHQATDHAAPAMVAARLGAAYAVAREQNAGRSAYR